jgi:hypothetical protein
MRLGDLDGHIIVTRKELPLGRFELSYKLEKWDENYRLVESNQINYVAIHTEELGYKEPPTLLSLGQYKFFLIQPMSLYMEMVGSVYTPYKPGARLRAFRAKLLTRFNWFYYRLIITANVWGLADRESYVTPSYRELHIYKWLKNQKERFSRISLF